MRKKPQFKKSPWLVLLTLALLMIMFTLSSKPLLAKTQTRPVKGRYYQTDARKMLSMLNTFRTGKQAWYYKKPGSKKKVELKKVKLKNLRKLKYDYKLEKVAMKRAAEIAVYFSHTRPDKTQWNTAFPSGYMYRGENLAMGTSSYMTAKTTMELWKETKESYNGQGHRRNMLYSSFKCVGIACFEYEGNKYWVQEFGSPRLGSKKTTAVNKVKTVKVKVKN